MTETEKRAELQARVAELFDAHEKRCAAKILDLERQIEAAQLDLSQARAMFETEYPEDGLAAANRRLRNELAAVSAERDTALRRAEAAEHDRAVLLEARERYARKGGS